MITNGESRIVKLVCVVSDGSVGSPCCACREFLMQLDEKSKDIEILTDYESKNIIKLGELVPDWWGYEEFEKRSA
jgi:cytidine deaminase